MTRPDREVWIFRVQLPANVANSGRFVARILKHLLRTWGVKCVAILDESHPLAQGERSTAQTTNEPAGGENAAQQRREAAE